MTFLRCCKESSSIVCLGVEDDCLILSWRKPHRLVDSWEQKELTAENTLEKTLLGIVDTSLTPH